MEKCALGRHGRLAAAAAAVASSFALAASALAASSGVVVPDCNTGQPLSQGSTTLGLDGSGAVAVAQVQGWAFCGETAQADIHWSDGALSSNTTYATHALSQGQCISVTADIGSASNGLAWQQSAGPVCASASGGGGGGGGTGSPPSVKVTASPATVSYASRSTVSWTTSGAPTSCTISGATLFGSVAAGGGSVSTGSLTVNPTVVRVSCSNAYGNGQGSVAIAVIESPPAQSCPAPYATGRDSDGDTVDDGCDATPFPGDPTTAAPVLLLDSDVPGPTRSLLGNRTTGSCPAGNRLKTRIYRVSWVEAYGVHPTFFAFSSEYAVCYKPAGAVLWATAFSPFSPYVLPPWQWSTTSDSGFPSATVVGNTATITYQGTVGICVWHFGCLPGSTHHPGLRITFISNNTETRSEWVG